MSILNIQLCRKDAAIEICEKRTLNPFHITRVESTWLDRGYRSKILTWVKSILFPMLSFASYLFPDPCFRSVKWHLNATWIYILCTTLGAADISSRTTRNVHENNLTPTREGVCGNLPTTHTLVVQNNLKKEQRIISIVRTVYIVTSKLDRLTEQSYLCLCRESSTSFLNILSIPVIHFWPNSQRDQQLLSVIQGTLLFYCVEKICKFRTRLQISRDQSQNYCAINFELLIFML